MAGSSPETTPGSEGFDPYRRRREIELMEQRFRERAERHGGGPVSTGEIDQRVADEMKQFFTESAERAAKVVPHLEEAPGGGMKETTGEIRRKIDDFFAQVKDAGGGAAAPNTQEIQAKRGRWQGYFPEQQPAAPAAAAGRRAGGVPPAPASSPGDPPRPTLTRMAPPGTAPVTPSASQYAAAAHAGMAAAPMAPSPAAAPAPRGGGDGERPKMDLKTALEKLRRHGVVSQTGGPGGASQVPPLAAAPQVARSPAAPPPAAAQSPSLGAQPYGAPAFGAQAYAAPAQPAAPARPAALPPRPAATPRAAAGAPLPPRREPTVRGLPAAGRPADTGPVPATTGVPVVPPRREPTRPGLPSIRRDVTPSAEVFPPAARREPPPPAGPPPHRSHFAESSQEVDVQPRRDRPASPSPAGAPSAAAAQRARVAPASGLPGRALPRRDAPPPVDRQIPRNPARAPAADEAPARAESPIRAARPRAMDLDDSLAQEPAPGDVLPPRRDSAAARMFQNTFRGAPQRPAPRATAPSPPPSPARKTAPDPSQSFDQIFDELQGLVLDTLRSSVDESFEAARAAGGAARPATGEVREPTGEVAAVLPPLATQEVDASALAAAADSAAADDHAGAAGPAGDAPESAAPDSATPRRLAVSPRLARPEEDEAADAPAEPEAEAQPYDWGVRRAPRPQGAWLVESENGLEAAPRKADVTPAPAPAAAAAPAEPAPNSMVGGRGYLVKKLGDEVKRFQPALDALRAKGVVSDRDLADPEDSQTAGGASQGGDDELSVESFKHRRPVDFDAELSPARLVEEIRRLRRLVDALVAKGVLDAADLQRSADE